MRDSRMQDSLHLQEGILMNVMLENPFSHEMQYLVKNPF